MYNNIDASWKSFFDNYKNELTQIFEQIKNDDVYPSKNMIFKVFEMNIDNINIVLVGQDPYHGKNQAMGLSFSVPIGEKIPPSLQNIFKEIKNEFPERKYNFIHGDLSEWTKQGIFLINAALTVKAGKANSHQQLWINFISDVISYINLKRSNIVFLLLGKDAAAKQRFVNDDKNHLVIGAHPSPLNASGKFIGSNVFKRTETKLNKKINWQN